MIDREARRKLAQDLRRFALGRTTNREFEEGLPTWTKDRTLRDVSDILEFNYEDIYGPSYRLTDDGALSRLARRQLARIMVFLQTDMEHKERPAPAITLRSVLHCAGKTLIILLCIALLAVPFAVLMPGFIVLHITHRRMLKRPSYKKAWSRLFPPKPEPEEHDDDIWPFESQSDYENALMNPTLLTGPRRNETPLTTDD